MILYVKHVLVLIDPFYNKMTDYRTTFGVISDQNMVGIQTDTAILWLSLVIFSQTVFELSNQHLSLRRTTAKSDEICAFFDIPFKLRRLFCNFTLSIKSLELA